LFVSCERQRCGLSGVRFHRQVISIDVQAMNYIRAKELDRNAVTQVDRKFRRRVRKLLRVDLKVSLLGRDNRTWQWRKSHDQSSRC
jgi:hypothetical protein